MQWLWFNVREYCIPNRQFDKYWYAHSHIYIIFLIFFFLFGHLYQYLDFWEGLWDVIIIIFNRKSCTSRIFLEHNTTIKIAPTLCGWRKASGQWLRWQVKCARGKATGKQPGYFQRSTWGSADDSGGASKTQNFSKTIIFQKSQLRKGKGQKFP